MNDGHWLTLGAVGALVLAGSRRYGSRQPMSRLQQTLLRLRKRLPDPEAVVRSFDFVISSLPDYPDTAMSGDLPGVWDTTHSLVAGIQHYLGNPDATMADYRDFVIQSMRDNHYLQAYNQEIDLNTDWMFTKQIPWLGTQIARVVKKKNRAQTRDPSAACKKRGYHDKTCPHEKELKQTLEHMRSRLSYVYDWVDGARYPREQGGPRTLRVNLSQYTFDQAITQSTRWHTEAREQASQAKIERMKKQGKWSDCPDGIALLRGEVVFTFDNGWTVQKLTTRQQFLEEGNLSKGKGCLRHCIGEGDYYIGQAVKGIIQVYSLRNPSNMPFITITVQNNSAIQAKGLQNRYAGTVSAHSGQDVAIMRRLGGVYPDIDAYLDAECVMITEFLSSIDVTWTGDQRPCQDRLRALAQRQRKQHARAAYEYGLGGGGNRRGSGAVDLDGIMGRVLGQPAPRKSRGRS